MTKNSYLCKLIQDNPNTWEHICEEKRIKVKKDDATSYAIFNYDIMADFFDPIVQEARGIIIDLEELKVVAWPFRKFGNFSEPYADKIDWSTARVQEKVDGSIVKMFYSEKLGEWCWATNGCIFAKDAPTATGSNYQALIESTAEYRQIQNIINGLDKIYTFIFELVGPENQVVIQYPRPALYHLSTRNNLDGTEFAGNITIPKPKEYPLQSLEDCIAAVESLNQGKDFPVAEGFVVVDAHYNRIKIKSPEYLIWHHKVNNGVIDKETAYELIHSDDFNFETFKTNVSEYVANKIEFYMLEFLYTKAQIVELMLKARSLKEKGFTRKDIAIQIKDNPYSYFGFKALDSDLEVKELIRELGSKAFLKCVKD